MEDRKNEYLGHPYLGETQEEANERVRKAKEHERSFGERQDPDIIKKRMDSDLFKGGWRS